MEVNYKNTHRSGKKNKKQCCSSLFKYPITLFQIWSPNRPILTESWQNQLFTHRQQCNTYDRLRQLRRWGQKSHSKHAAFNLQCSDLCAGHHVCNPPPDPRFLQQALTFRRFLLHICPCQISMNQGRLPAGQVSHNPLQVQEQKAMRWCTGSSDLTEKKKKNPTTKALKLHKSCCFEFYFFIFSFQKTEASTSIIKALQVFSPVCANCVWQKGKHCIKVNNIRNKTISTSYLIPNL